MLAKYWKVPIRTWLRATLVRIAPGSDVSRITYSPVSTDASARVDVIPSAFIASLIRCSLRTGPRGDLPSPALE